MEGLPSKLLDDNRKPTLTNTLDPPSVLKMASQISRKRKIVADGVFRAELNEFFTRELSEEGYSGCDVRVTHTRTEVRPYFARKNVH